MPTYFQPLSSLETHCFLVPPNITGNEPFSSHIITEGQFDDAFPSSDILSGGQFDDAPEDNYQEPNLVKRKIQHTEKNYLPHTMKSSKKVSKSPLDYLASIATTVSSTSIEIPLNIDKKLIVKIQENDVLCGRGGLTNHHPGNIQYRRMVRALQTKYLISSKCHKSRIAKAIVDDIRSMNPPGRFLKKDSRNHALWHDIGDQKAREKTSQALRERPADMRDVVLATTNHLVIHYGRAVTPPVADKRQVTFSPGKMGLKRKRVLIDI